MIRRQTRKPTRWEPCGIRSLVDILADDWFKGRLKLSHHPVVPRGCRLDSSSLPLVLRGTPGIDFVFSESDLQSPIPITSPFHGCYRTLLYRGQRRDGRLEFRHRDSSFGMDKDRNKRWNIRGSSPGIHQRMKDAKGVLDLVNIVL